MCNVTSFRVRGFFLKKPRDLRKCQDAVTVSLNRNSPGKTGMSGYFKNIPTISPQTEIILDLLNIESHLSNFKYLFLHLMGLQVLYAS